MVGAEEGKDKRTGKRSAIEQSSSACRTSVEDVFMSTTSVELSSTSEEVGITPEGEAAVLPAVTVAKRLSVSLYLWMGALMFVMVVEIYTMIRLILKLPQEGPSDWRPVARGTIIGTVAASTFLLLALQAGLALAAAAQINHARSSTYSIDVITTSLQKAIIYLSTVFNVLSLNSILQALTDLAIAAVMWPQILAAITVSILCIATFWVSGFLAVQLWYGRCVVFTSDHLTRLLSTPPEELWNVPWYIKMWMFQVFGRLAPDKPTSKPGKARGIYKFKLDLARLEEIQFGSQELLALKLLPEAMVAAGRGLAYSAYAQGLVIATLVINEMWSNIFSVAIGLLRNILSMIFILSGSILFSRAIAVDNSDMLNLIYGFDSLRNTFTRLSRMVAIASVGQLISLLVTDFV